MVSSFPPPSLALLGKRVFELLRKRGEKVCLMETACGGLMSATLLAIPGASAIFAGSQTLYTLPSRIALSDWTPEHVANYGGPTPAVVEGLCASLRARLCADLFSEADGANRSNDNGGSGGSSQAPPPPSRPQARRENPARLWALGESGTAGPGRSGEGRNRTPGYVALAVVGPGVSVGTDEETGSADRVGNMVVFAEKGLELLIRCIEEAEARERVAGGDEGKL